MPRRTDVNRVLVVGAGPIVIGQACEFDYSGSQLYQHKRTYSQINADCSRTVTHVKWFHNPLLGMKLPGGIEGARSTGYPQHFSPRFEGPCGPTRRRPSLAATGHHFDRRISTI